MTLSQLRGQSQADVSNKYLLCICDAIYAEHAGFTQFAADVAKHGRKKIAARKKF